MWDKAVPEMQREVWVAAAQAGDEPSNALELKLLHPYRLNPRLSAEAQLNGVFDFNRTPLAPPGKHEL